MNGALRWITASPLGAALAGLVAFFFIFLFLGQNVTLTVAAFGAVILGLVILVRPEYGVHFLLFHFVVSLPQYFKMPRFGPLSMPMLLEGILLLAFLVQLTFFKKRLYINVPETWLILGYTVLILLSLLMADHVGAGNFAVLRQLYLMGFILYFLITNLIDEGPAFVRMMATLVISDLALVLSGFLHFAGLLEPAKIDADRLGERTAGILGNPNSLAFVLIGLFPLVVGLIIYVRSTWARALLLLLAAANLFIILNTLSRGGLMALGAAIVLMTFRVSRDRRLVALLVLLGIVTYLLLPAALFERFDDVESLRGNSRYILTMIGVRMALANPFLGVGFNNFERYFARYDLAHRGGSTAPHNLYTSIAAQTGIPSLLVYLGIIVVSWRRLTGLMRRFRSSNDRFLWLLAVALQASLLNILVFGLTHHVEHQTLFFVIVASVVVLDRLSSTPEEVGSPLEEPPALKDAIGLAGKPA